MVPIFELAVDLRTHGLGGLVKTLLNQIPTGIVGGHLQVGRRKQATHLQ